MHSAAVAADARADPLDHTTTGTFDEVVAFYTESKFLYPAKLAQLGARLETVRRTWQRLMTAEDIFTLLLLRRRVDQRSVVKNSLCAFEYAPGVWQVQHLVSADRHERAGTLTALLAMTDGLCARTGFTAYRLTYRPDNPGTTRLFGELANVLPRERSHTSRTTYRLVSSTTLGEIETDRGVRVRIARRDDIAHVAAMYAAEHPALPTWLSLDDVNLSGLDARYQKHRLTRRRTLLVAEHAGLVCGSIACWWSSEGINFSFMENAASDLVVDRSLPAQVRRTVARSLLAAALRTYECRGRSYAVLMIDDELDRLVASAGPAWDAPAKQYLTLTFSGEDAPAAHAHFEQHYADAAATRSPNPAMSTAGRRGAG